MIGACAAEENTWTEYRAKCERFKKKKRERENGKRAERHSPPNMLERSGGWSNWYIVYGICVLVDPPQKIKKKLSRFL